MKLNCSGEPRSVTDTSREHRAVYIAPRYSLSLTIHRVISITYRLKLTKPPLKAPHRTNSPSKRNKNEQIDQPTATRHRR